MILMTQTAAKKISQLRVEEGAKPEAMLRVMVKKRGCSGLSYELKFDSDVKDGDKIFEHYEEKVVVDGQSLLYLIGLSLDYKGGLNGQGFIFSNPNATKTCSCGSSFGV